MAPKRTPKNAAKKPQKTAAIIELSSDSEPDVPAVKENESEPAKESTSGNFDYDDMPLLKVEGIKYDTESTTEKKDVPSASEPKPAKLPVRVKDTGSARHRHVSIEIPLLTSSMLAKGAKSQEAPRSEDGNEEEVFKTPMERRHITYNDSDNEEFVTPLEAPSRNPLEIIEDAKGEVPDSEEEVEDSDDEAPPEAISSHAAGAHLAKASQAATEAAQKQAAAQKQKRQERDAFFKQQAEKRKGAQSPSIPKGEDESDEPRAQGPAPLSREKRKREVPKLLPLEFLESDDEDEVANYSDSSVDKGRTKKQKVASGWIPEPKATKDQKVGSTVFRVVENRGDKKLAPKAKKTAVNMREQLLKRKKAPQAKGGFFVKSH
ncbi:hypothetical protein B0T16DRAFT_458231 [Cercophora newfieldiana]|uniref:Uncharacterized protein n=1 Tax=Cercophora newfieldiana TaxID=92897 RepID=A0AA40CPB7_9PEZI|nr:hypothetical protein B0T16DRAFT_458231 [Cercophora newfieldiana]